MHKAIQHFVVFLLIYAVFKSDSILETSCSAFLPVLDRLVA